MDGEELYGSAEMTDKELFSYLRYRFLSERCLYEGFVASVESALKEIDGVERNKQAEFIVDRIIGKDSVVQ